MILNERDSRHEHVLNVARQMMTAARTAPKGKGIDIIETAIVTGEEIQQLSDTLKAMFEEFGMKFFLRDADNILQAECILLIGTREQAQGLNCGHCGYATCSGRSEGVPCALNSIDAVSYTHLDVYKRQALRPGPCGEQKRHHSQYECKRGHQDRTQPDMPGFIGRCV